MASLLDNDENPRKSIVKHSGEAAIGWLNVVASHAGANVNNRIVNQTRHIAPASIMIKLDSQMSLNRVNFQLSLRQLDRRPASNM